MSERFGVLDMEKIAKGLGAKRRGKVAAGGGFFGALQVAEEVRARFRVPAKGGRATDPTWTERRLVPLKPETLARLEALAVELQKQSDVGVGPMQLAAMLLERFLDQISEHDTEELLRTNSTKP